MYEIILRLAPKVILAVIITLLLYVGYTDLVHIGYRQGYSEAEQKYTQIINDNNAAVDRKISSIETLSTNLANITNTSNDKMTTDIAAILNKVKTKPLVIIKNGDCVPSQTFSDSFSQVNKRANQSMQELQK